MNKIDRYEIEHYRKVLLSMMKNNLERYVCFHHFIVPKWFMDIGGFEDKKNLIHWNKYVRTITAILGEEIDLIHTINEPLILVEQAFTNLYNSCGLTEPFPVCM